MKSTHYKFLAAASLVFFLNNMNLRAQEVSLSADVMSRFVWRGSDLGSNSPSIQPEIEFSYSGLTAGFWGAYSLSESAALNEIDIYLKYSIEIESTVSFYFGATDYINPNSGVRLGNFGNYNSADGGGAHFVELNLGIVGLEHFPLSLSFNYFIHNVPNNPIYIELGYPVSLDDVELNFFLGATTGDAESYYGVDRFGVINFGFSAAKEIKITDDFCLPVSGSVILNPASENMFFIFGLTL